MADFPLPSASAVRLSSRLLPENVSLAFTGTADFETDITARITVQANTVQRRLVRAAAPLVWPFDADDIALAYDNYTALQQADIITSHEADATEATRLYTLADLFDSAGQLSEQYQLEADNYRKRADELMASLIEEIQFVKGQSTTNDNADGMAIVTVLVGENFPDEDDDA